MLPFNSLSLFWFSGTGNAGRVCDWFSETAKQYGVVAHKINLGTTNRKVKPMIKVDTLIGFISPTHGFNFPPLMIKYILRFPKSPGNCHVFLVNTRGGTMLYKWFLPGASGIALLLAALLLLFKGYKVVGMRSIDLPSNWISLHPCLRQKAIVKLHKRCKAKTEQFAQKIVSGKKGYRALLDLPIDLLLTPIAIGYYLLGRFFLAKTFLSTQACDNCGLCYQNCPVNAIKQIHGRPFWTVKCESCMQCMNKCPKKAIETAHGLIYAVIILTNSIVLSGLLKIMIESGIHIPEAVTKNGVIWFLIQSLFYMLVIIVAYRFVHFMQGFTWFDKLVMYTSLTHLCFWNRYQPWKILKKNP